MDRPVELAALNLSAISAYVGDPVGAVQVVPYILLAIAKTTLFALTGIAGETAPVAEAFAVETAYSPTGADVLTPLHAEMKPAFSTAAENPH